VLLANADGALQMKGSSRDISIPVTIKYLRAERRKYDGKRGDILLVVGEIPLNRTDFGISSDDMFDLIKDNISVKVSLVGSSDKCRSLLPSRLFF
jgi:polyisoprenoid-binding protein YceI